jgi:hypothetical protein
MNDEVVRSGEGLNDERVNISRYHRQAALTYVGLGALVIFITFAAGLVPAGRSNPIAELSIGAVFLAIFAVLIYLQPCIEVLVYLQPRVESERRGVHIVVRDWWLLSALLVFSNTWRMVIYFNDGLGWHIELLPFSITRIEPQPVAFVNAALMAVIVIMLARSAWAGFSRWRTP